jgi:predicted transcriptional regulator
MDPEIIRRIKSAAALRDTTASMVMEEAAAEWLERHQGKK